MPGNRTFEDDALGRRLNESISGEANSDTVAYDVLGRVSSRQNKLGGFIPTYIGSTGRMDFMTLPKGYVTDYAYFNHSGDNRLQTIQHKTPGGANISKLDYTYDASGQILSITDQIDTAVPRKATGTNNSNPYDAAAQLTSWETRNTANNNVLSSHSYSYDLAGNRTAKSGSTIGYNNLNQLTSSGGNSSYAYDFNGNRSAAPLLDYEWDAANRMTAYTFGNLRVEYSYNAEGQMWRAVKKTNGVVAGELRYLWIGSQVREQRSSGGNQVLQRYFDGGAITNDATKLLALQDHLGSVRELIDASTTLNIRARYRYPEPYGFLPTKVSGDLDSSFRFANYFIEPYSGNVFTQHRIYNLAEGRWLSRDPLGDIAFLSTYSKGKSWSERRALQRESLRPAYLFVSNNSINNADMLGLICGIKVHRKESKNQVDKLT